MFLWFTPTHHRVSMVWSWLVTLLLRQDCSTVGYGSDSLSNDWGMMFLHFLPLIDIISVPLTCFYGLLQPITVSPWFGLVWCCDCCCKIASPLDMAVILCQFFEECSICTFYHWWTSLGSHWHDVIVYSNPLRWRHGLVLVAAVVVAARLQYRWIWLWFSANFLGNVLFGLSAIDWHH